MRTPTRTTGKLIPIAASAAIALGGLGLAACGGDDETATTDGGLQGGSELASEADQLCTAASDEIAARDDVPDFGPDGLQSRELKDAAAYFEANAESQTQLLDDLSALEPDSSQADDWNAFLEAYEVSSVTVAEDLAAEAAKGDQEAFFQIALDAQQDAQKLATAAAGLGLTACGASEAGSSSGA